MRIFLCNEVIRELDFAAQCRFVRETGYHGIELAPFTLGADPGRIRADEVHEFRRIADGEGVEIAGLHWLLAAPTGLSITSDDAAVTVATLEAGRRLIDLCAQFGGAYLVHGSPLQRQLASGREQEGKRRGTDYFAAIAPAAEAFGLRYIIEPLARADTGFVNSVEDALAIIGQIGSPALGTMVDCYAAASNGEDIPRLLQRWVPQGVILHVHFNDLNRRGPGEGELDFATILDMLCRLDYGGACAVEPFVHLPDGPSCAARAIGFLRGIVEGQAHLRGKQRGV